LNGTARSERFCAALSLLKTSRTPRTLPFDAFVVVSSACSGSKMTCSQRAGSILAVLSISWLCRLCQREERGGGRRLSQKHCLSVSVFICGCNVQSWPSQAVHLLNTLSVLPHIHRLMRNMMEEYGCVDYLHTQHHVQYCLHILHTCLHCRTGCISTACTYHSDILSLILNGSLMYGTCPRILVNTPLQVLQAGH